MTTITYGSSVKETAKSRRHARRRAAAIERDNLEGVIDAAFGIRALSAAEERERVAKRKDAIKKWAVVESGCSSLKVARAINGPSVRDVKVESGAMCLPQVAIFAAGYRKPTESVTAR